MTVKKWVECSQEVEVSIGADDVRCALTEAFARVPRDIDDHPHRHDITDALNSIAQFLRAMTDEHIALLTEAQRKTVREFLLSQGARY